MPAYLGVFGGKTATLPRTRSINAPHHVVEILPRTRTALVVHDQITSAARTRAAFLPYHNLGMLRIDAPTTLAVTGSSTPTVGLPTKYTATATFSDGTTQYENPLVTWSLSNTSIGTIDSYGNYTPSSAGSQTITATYKGITGSDTVTGVGISSVAVTPSNSSVLNQHTVQFILIATRTDGATVNVTQYASWGISVYQSSSSGATSGLITSPGGLYTALQPSGINTIQGSFVGVSGTTNVTNLTRGDIVTQVATEHLESGPAKARITQVLDETLLAGSAKARVTQVLDETLLAGSAKARITGVYLEVMGKTPPPPNIRITQAVVLALTKANSNVRITQATVLALVAAQAAGYDPSAFIQRMIDLFPKSWVSKSALLPGGALYVFFKAVGTALAAHKVNQLDYTQKQTRILTATGANLDNIALDFFGSTVSRNSGESDAAFAARIIQNVVAPKATLAAVQAAVTNYYNTQFVTSDNKKPTAIVFDSISNPALAAEYNITPPEFAIAVTFPVPAGTGWALGRKYLGYDTILINTSTYTAGSFNDPILQQIVQNIKGEGTKPVYLQKRSY